MHQKICNDRGVLYGNGSSLCSTTAGIEYFIYPLPKSMAHNCPYCFAYIGPIQVMAIHVVSHDTDKKYRCWHCWRTGSSRVEVFNHVIQEYTAPKMINKEPSEEEQK